MSPPPKIANTMFIRRIEYTIPTGGNDKLFRNRTFTKASLFVSVRERERERERERKKEREREREA